MTDKKTPKPMSAVSPTAARLSIAAIAYQATLLALIFISTGSGPFMAHIPLTYETRCVNEVSTVTR